MSEPDFLLRALGVGTDTAGSDGDSSSLAAHDAIDVMNSAFRIVTDAMPQMVWSTLPDGLPDYYNERWYEFTGMLPGSTDGEGWNNMVHPEDRALALQIWNTSVKSGEQYETSYRLRHHSGEYRWTLARGLPFCSSQGNVVRWIGTCTDIHEARMIAEENEVLSRELSHRIKNIFAVINGLIGMSARQSPELQPLAAELQERIAALGRAHEFVRPHSERSLPLSSASTLRGLLTEILGAYPALGDGRLTIDGDNPAIDDRNATPIALVFHELATNSAKYGALSSPDGRVQIAITQTDEEVAILWTENGGPQVTGEPSETGFGTRLVQLAITQQLAGRIKRHWPATGLMVEMHIAASRLRKSDGAPV